MTLEREENLKIDYQQKCRRLSRLLNDNRRRFEAAKQELQTVHQAKNYFMAQIGHDLRQPLQALQLFAQTLSEEPLDSSARLLVQKILASADNLKSLLDNMLDLGKLDSGGFCAEFTDFDLGGLFCRLCMEYHHVAASRDIQIVCHVNNIRLNSDIVLIERMVRNLFSNALKYAQGKILLSCRQFRQWAQIRIIDNGIGISVDDIQHIFEEFYQCRQVQNNRAGGAGLGLSIVRKIADLLGAKIRVRSKLGAYTAFEVSLPMSVPAPTVVIPADTGIR